MQIGEMAALTGMSRDALRFYERRGLITSVRRANGYRHYPEATEAVLRYIKTAKMLGFRLAEIEKQIPRLTEKQMPPDELQQMLIDKKQAVEERIAVLTELREELSARIGRACPLV